MKPIYDTGIPPLFVLRFVYSFIGKINSKQDTWNREGSETLVVMMSFRSENTKTLNLQKKSD